MEDRRLQAKKRLRRQRQIKRRKKSLFFRRLLVFLFLLALLYGGYRLVKAIMDRPEDEKASQESQTKEEVVLSLEKEEEEKKKGPAVDTKITPEMKKKDMDQRLKQFIKDKKLTDKDISLGYYNLKNDEAFSFNEKAEFSVGFANNFMLAMDLYDLTEEKAINLDSEIEVQSASDSKNKLANKYTLRELIKLMVENSNEEARSALITYVEEKSSKNWYDELSTRYGLDLSYNNKMTVADSLKILRRLFSEKRLTAEERIEAKTEEEKVYVYQELINFMSSKASSSPVTNNLKRRAQVSDNYGLYYGEGALLGFVLGNDNYLYTVMSTKAEGSNLFDALSVIDQWHTYYNN